MLKIKKRKDRWITLTEASGDDPACRLLVKPYSSLGKGSGQDHVQRAMAAGANPGEAGVAFSIGLAVWAAVDWEGVGDEDGAPLTFSPEGVRDLLEQHDAAYESFDRLYVLPALLEDREKNGSSPSPDGTSPAGARTLKTKTPKASPGAVETTAAAATASASPAPTN